MAAQSPFTRIYLDTQPLRQSNWPNVSATLEKLFSSAAKAPTAIPVYLPAPVEQELEAQFSRDYVKAVQAIDSAKSNTNGLLKRAGHQQFNPQPPPQLDGVLQSYRQRVEAVKQQWQLQSVALTRRQLADVFAMRLARQQPFNEKGDGLGDVIICHSLIDHLSGHPDEVGLLVTADGDYKGIQQVAADRGARLATMTIDAAISAIQARFTGAMLQFLEERSQQSRQSVEAVLPQLTEYVRSNFDIEMTDLTSLGETLKEVEDLERVEIEGVYVSPFLAVVPEGQQVTLNVQFVAHFRVAVEMAVYPPLPRVKVGEGFEKYSNQLLIAMLTGEAGAPERKELQLKIVKVKGEAKATARRTANGYNEITWTAVGPKTTRPSMRALYDLAV